MLVRPAIPADHEAWLDLWDGYNRFYERNLDAEVSALTWSRFFDAYEPMHLHVAEDESGELIGMVQFLYHRNTAMRGPVCYLQDLFTSEAVRGKGVGRALIASVYAAARVAGSSRVYWQTHETNTVAQRLYESLAEKSGFIVYRRAIEPAFD